ncbi:hypothetical protein JOB18_022784 [Xyrichtys novacula]|uniref:Uncharacterized protein n=1 Tax=Xyrichtys novacula TaxID=13765 RepID=A0AAV1FJ81_XYRNO|nr:hypothetical protein JOB18_022784 [Xyrichtys novacula]
MEENLSGTLVGTFETSQCPTYCWTMWALRSVASSHTANYPIPDKQQVNQRSPPHPKALDTYSSSTAWAKRSTAVSMQSHNWQHRITTFVNFISQVHIYTIYFGIRYKLY